MDFLFVTITAITVSVDSFVAGFSLSLNKKRNLQLPMTVAAVTYLLCVVACIVGQILRPFLENYVKYFGAAILFALGAMSVVRQEGICLSDISFGQCVAIGVSVGFDGAAACLSLAVQGLGNVLTLPLLFCRNALYGGVCRTKSCRHKTPTKHKLFVGRDVFCTVRGEIAGFVKKHAPNKRCVQLVVAVFTNV